MGLFNESKMIDGETFCILILILYLSASSLSMTNDKPDDDISGGPSGNIRVKRETCFSMCTGEYGRNPSYEYNIVCAENRYMYPNRCVAEVCHKQKVMCEGACPCT